MPLLDSFLQNYGALMYAQKQHEDQLNEHKQDQAVQMAMGSLQHMRPEDLPKAWGHIENIIKAKNADQAHKALGNLITDTVPENPQQEQQVQTKNDLGRTIFDQGMPEGKSTPQDPAAYAQGKIRMKTLEGDEQRKINVYNAQQKVLNANRIALEAIKTKDKIATIEAQNKGKMDKLGTTYDDTTNTTTIHYRDRNTGEVKSYDVEGRTGQVYSADQRAETMDKVLKAKSEYQDKQLKQQMQIHLDKMEQWNSSRALKAQEFIAKTKNTAVAGQVRAAMTAIRQHAKAAQDYYAIAAKKDTDPNFAADALSRAKKEHEDMVNSQNVLEQFLSAQPDLAGVEDAATAPIPAKPTEGANNPSSPTSAPKKTSGAVTIKDARDSFFKK